MNVTDKVAEIGINLSAIIQGLMLVAIVGGGKMGIDLMVKLSGDVNTILLTMQAIQSEVEAQGKQITQIAEQSDENSRELASRKNIRFNLPDMVEWVEETRKLNQNWHPAPPLHKYPARH